jgi:SAM-dependent methyltransferase
LESIGFRFTGATHHHHPGFRQKVESSSKTVKLQSTNRQQQHEGKEGTAITFSCQDKNNYLLSYLTMIMMTLFKFLVPICLVSSSFVGVVKGFAIIRQDYSSGWKQRRKSVSSRALQEAKRRRFHLSSWLQIMPKSLNLYYKSCCRLVADRSLTSLSSRTTTEGETTSLSERQHQQNLLEALERFYPSDGLDSRIAVSRKDGYWPYIQKGEDPPQQYVYGEFDIDFFSQVLVRSATYLIDNGDNDLCDAGNHGDINEENGPSFSSPWENKVFCDLGSGTGRLVIAAAALHPWRTCRGIELLGGIHQEAVKILKEISHGNAEEEDSSPSSFETSFSSSNASLVVIATDDDNRSDTIPLAPIQFICGSFDDPYEFYGDANLIFVFSSCMNTHVLINLARSIGRQCRPGCLVLTTEYKLPLGGIVGPLEDDPDYPTGEYAFELLESITGFNMATGGESTVHIHRIIKALGDGHPRSKPELSVEEMAFRAIKAAEDPLQNNPTNFLRRVSNQMAFIGLPESWRPKLNDQQQQEDSSAARDIQKS